MSLRRRVLAWLDLDARIREVLRADLAARALPDASEIDALRGRIDALEKKLKMTMGSVQASSTQLMSLHEAVDKVRAEAAQAGQQATTARATAESVAEGLEALEARTRAPEPVTAGVAGGSPGPVKGTRSKSPKRS